MPYFIKTSPLNFWVKQPSQRGSKSLRQFWGPTKFSKGTRIYMLTPMFPFRLDDQFFV